MTIDNTDNQNAKNQENILLESLENIGLHLEQKNRKRVTDKIKEIRNYVPKVGILGKTGAGKSSLCNALFGKEVAEISDIAACTREPQHILLSMSQDTGGGLVLVDVPGVGESKERDEEYSELYKKLLPELDLVLWVIKADDRAFSVDQEIYKTCVEPHSQACQIVFVLNQVDKIEPIREWNNFTHQPSLKQLENIRKKAELVAKAFDINTKEDVCAVSANESFGLVALVEHIVNVLPNEKKYAFVREAKEENVSQESEKNAEKGIWDAIKEYAAKVTEFYVENKEAIHAAIATVWTWFSKSESKK